MEDEQRRGWWRKAVAIGGSVLAVLLVLAVIGLVLGRKGESNGQPAQVTTGEVEEFSGPVVPPQTNAADMMRRIEGETGVEEAGAPGEKYSSEPLAEDEAPATAKQKAAKQKTIGTQTSIQTVPTVEVKTIRTAALTVEIEKGKFNNAYSRVSLAAEGVGGYVSDSRSATSGGKITSGTVTIRVPNSSYADVMGQLREMGEVTSVSEQAQDVTEEYVDLESRIRNLRAQEAVYLNLMAKAQTIEESISVQRELSVIQEQIEQLTGRKNYLDNHVQFSTIQVTLTEPGAEAVVDGDGWGFVDALSDAAHGVVDGLSAVIRFLGNALVYIIILALIALGLYFLLRKYIRNKE
ncbi:MAG: DUF4349 domain-containing protein [Actinobacteria bacterium]|nr:DUF4349 domain-containing protein [Actinomycetota bacterium]MBU4385435.1 DUF4349 domain-containing protein [Actinomycetota bacterium]MBU4489132.1 DUF4349 domain-containing protein [Actinomycetota bacterium]